MRPNLHSFADELIKLSAFAAESAPVASYGGSPAPSKPALKGDVLTTPPAATPTPPSPLTTPRNMVGNSTFPAAS